MINKNRQFVIFDNPDYVFGINHSWLS